MRIIRSALRNASLAVGAVIAVLLSGNAIAGVLEDCVTAYEGKNYAAALQPCLSLAEHGDARAQLSLAGMYYNGQGAQQDYTEAAKWTRKAAEQGYTPAQADLGVLYWNGQWPRGAARRCSSVHVAQFGGRTRAGCGGGT
jgi:TPR repeat protein